jgi:tetratricopeptide (TPR) repeat protein
MARAEPASALFLPWPDVSGLLALCGKFPAGELPQVFRLGDGFLLKLRAPAIAHFAPTIRLRRLAANLHLPVDAELLPSLLDDEAEALARQRGLVFLPGGQVLSFAPDEPVPLSSLVQLGSRQDRSWQPLPAPRPLAEQLHEVILELPSDSAEELLVPGGADLGTEEPRPEDSGVPAKVAATVTMHVGRGIFGLGAWLGLKGLVRLGARWMQNALSMAPRLSEELLGRQEAALRALLREFRLGNLERALRRALPLTESGDRGHRASGSAALPMNDIRYSLTSLLGTRDAGGVWLGHYDVLEELRREYRKAAEAAVCRGDYRRAAWIYGKLLRNYHLAANALFEGGLFHDAGLVYLKVQDTRSAARAFAAAGEIDRAVALYRQRGDHVEAGDLLRRAGEEEAALIEYQLAADRLAALPQGHLAAGELLLDKAGRADLALPYFRTGWSARPSSGALPCASRMADLYADQGAQGDLLSLLCEAEEFLAPPGNDTEAGRFFDAMARLGERPQLAAIRDELRDRALLGIATKLRQRALVETRPGTIVSSFLGRSQVWSSALVSDAHVAFKDALRPAPHAGQTERSESAERQVTAGGDLVTAACLAPLSGDVFLGFHSGAVTHFTPLKGPTTLVTSQPPTVTSLAVDREGKFLVVLRQSGTSVAELAAHVRTPSGTYELMQTCPLEGPGDFWLAPLGVDSDHQSKPGHRGELLFGVWNGEELGILPRSLLGWRHRIKLPDPTVPVCAGLLLPAVAELEGGPILLLFDPDSVWGYFDLEKPSRALFLGWRPCNPPGNSLRSPAVAWLRGGPRKIEFAGLTRTGQVRWHRLVAADHRISCVSANASEEEGYLAATIVRSRLVAGVRNTCVDWLRCSLKGFIRTSLTKIAIPSPITCFPCHATNELIVVGRDGSMSRAPVPS